MPAIDFEALTAPVEPDDPCGPDLDLAADSAYLNFLAGAEGRLPSSYFDGKDESGALGRPFQVSKIELDGVVAAATPLLAKTRDLRLLVLLAKYCMLGREFEQFRTLIRAIAALLNGQWEGVHPRSEDGEFQARLVAVESIDVQPTVIMPLQFLPLIEHRRFGTVSYRGYLIATGAIAPREGEDVIDLSTIEKITRETGAPALVAKRSEFSELGAALDAISRTWSEKDSSGPSVQLDKVVDVVKKIVAFLDEAATRLDPSSALVPAQADNAEDVAAEDGADAPGRTVAAGRVTTSAEAAAALNAVADYFARNEPSSPTLLLVRQANQLLGKSFIEVMRTLVPTHVEQAAINIGRAETFNLPIERLSSFAGDGAGAEATNGAGGQTADDAAIRHPVARSSAGTAGSGRCLLSCRGAFEPDSVPHRARPRSRPAGFPQCLEGAPASRYS